MSYKTSMVGQEQFSAVRKVLLELWDPIGVADYPTAQDEYDSYVWQIIRMLHEGAGEEEIARHLIEIETKLMGLLPARITATAKGLRDLLVDGEIVPAGKRLFDPSHLHYSDAALAHLAEKVAAYNQRDLGDPVDVVGVGLLSQISGLEDNRTGLMLGFYPRSQVVAEKKMADMPTAQAAGIKVTTMFSVEEGAVLDGRLIHWTAAEGLHIA